MEIEGFLVFGCSRTEERGNEKEKEGEVLSEWWPKNIATKLQISGLEEKLVSRSVSGKKKELLVVLLGFEVWGGYHFVLEQNMNHSMKLLLTLNLLHFYIHNFPSLIQLLLHNKQ